MNVRVCYHYQKGECLRKESCKFFHPRVKCRSFRSAGWCPYGYNCHFWHCPADGRDNVHLEKKLCDFFVNGQCKYGDKCSCSHDLSQLPVGTTLSEYKAAKELASKQLGKEKSPEVKSNLKPLTCESLEALLHARSTQILNVKSDEARLERLKCIHITKSLEDVQKCSKSQTAVFDSEMKRLSKMFPPSKLMELESYNDNRVFCLKFSSTDPDWVYFVREILLSMTFPKSYPLLPFKATVLDHESLPTVLIQHLNSSIADWIKLKHQALNGSNKQPTPYLKFFFHWLDRNLEELFTEGLRMYKAILNATNSNPVTSNNPDPQDEPDQSSSESSVASFSIIDDNPVTTTPNRKLAQRPTHFSRTQLDDIQDLESDLDPESDDPDQSDSNLSSDFSDCQGDHGKDYELVDSQDKKCAECQTTAAENRPTEATASSAITEPCSSSSSLPTQATVAPTTQPRLASTQPSCVLPQSNVISSSGSQVISLGDFKLCGKAGTFLPSNLCTVLHCIRCRLTFDWKFNLHGQSKSKTDPNSGADAAAAAAADDDTDGHNEFRLRSLPPHTTSCARCKQQFSLIFQASIAHAFENRSGTLYLDGCIADDLPSKQSNGILFCTECSNPVKIMGLVPGHPITRRCFQCHSLVGMEYSKFELKLLKDPTQNLDQKSAVPNSNPEKISRKLRRAMKNPQNLIIQEGTPLPQNGTCRHYDKSYRWLRFPCCGRLEPCILCHNKSATDGHETLFATRMVCGFCSKEQPFSASNPCTKCGKKLTGGYSSHWEGGRGCRNKTTMSRKDSKKYADLNKTVSKNKQK